MLRTQQLYQRTYLRAQKNSFRIEDLMSDGQELDFSKPFLPETLVRTEQLSFLSVSERLIFNQLRGYSYLCLFGIVEELILPFVLDQVRSRFQASDVRVRALLQFASEEAKHIELFRRFQTQFQCGFELDCQVVGPADEIGKVVLSHHPLGVALSVLMFEWMTQAHYLESVREDGELDPHFKQLLKHHWLEEAQHAVLDGLMVEELGESCSAHERSQAFDQFLAIAAFLDSCLGHQLENEMDAFQRKTGRVLRGEELAQLRGSQRAALRYTFLGSGMMHPKFRAALLRLEPRLLSRLSAIVSQFC